MTVFNILDLSLKLNGFPLEKAKAYLSSIIAIPEDKFEDFTNQKRKEIVAYHLSNNLFYKNLAKNKSAEFSLENWNDLPVLTKTDFQQSLSERLSSDFNTKNVYINRTSGSSGDPFIFAKDKFCHALVWSSIYYRFGWYGLDLNKAYQARFYGYPLEFLNKYKVKLKDFFSNRYRLPIFDLSDEALKKFVEIFKSKKFHYINGYTSSIVMMAKYLEKENIVLKTICPTLKVCIVTSEMLFEEDKALLEKQLGVPVVNEYGASELDIIAFQNKDDEWIVNAENLFVEILDDQNIPLPFGEEGNIVITALYNKAHPFIRYKIGDMGILEKKSSKKIILKKLTGRTNDFAFLPSGKKAPGMTFYSITKTVMEEDGNLKEFVIAQTEKNRFEIEYVSEKPLSNERIFYFEKKLTDYLEEGLTFTFIRKEKLERSKSGKLKQFKSLVSAP